MGFKLLSLFLALGISCSVLMVVAHPQLFGPVQGRNDHHSHPYAHRSHPEPEESGQPEYLEVVPVKDEDVDVIAVEELPSLQRYRRNPYDSVPAADTHKGWGWPKEQKGWGWPSVGPVFTYVRTDGWSNFQWGVRHKVGKGAGRRK